MLNIAGLYILPNSQSLVRKRKTALKPGKTKRRKKKEKEGIKKKKKGKNVKRAKLRTFRKTGERRDRYSFEEKTGNQIYINLHIF